MADRSFNLLADGTPVPFAGSARLEGEDSLSLFPALFRLELRNLPEETYLRLTRAKTLSVSHEGACLVSGRITDSFRRTAPGGTATEIAICAGLDLWKARVSLSVPKGTRVSGTVRRILEDSGTGIPLLAAPTPDPKFLRPGTFYGRAAECAERALSAAGCRAASGCAAGRSLSGEDRGEEQGSGDDRAGSQHLVKVVFHTKTLSCFVWLGKNRDEDKLREHFLLNDSQITFIVRYPKKD